MDKRIGKILDSLELVEKRLDRLECQHYDVEITKTFRAFLSPPFSYEYKKVCESCGKSWDSTEKEYLQTQLDKANKSCRAAEVLRKQIK